MILDKKTIAGALVSIGLALGANALLSWRQLPTMDVKINAAQSTADEAKRKADDDGKILYELKGEMKGLIDETRGGREDIRTLREVLQNEIRYHKR